MNCLDCIFCAKHESDGINPEWHECECDLSDADAYWDEYGLENNEADEKCPCFCRDKDEAKALFEE